MLEHRTSLVATSISGNSLSQTRARAILPILVRQAMARQKIPYGKLGEEVGVHHRALRYPLGCIRKILDELSEQWREDIPSIQGIVVNQDTDLPGDSVIFLLNRELNPREKEAIVEAELRSVYIFLGVISIAAK